MDFKPNKEELQFLKELQKVYTNPSERQSSHKRSSLICRFAGILLIALAYFLNHIGKLSSGEIIGIGIFGGILIGIGYLLLTSAKQVPWLDQYTKPKADLITDRINEIENQRLEPTRITPVDEVESDSREAHP